MSKLLSDSPSCSLVENLEIKGRIDAAYYASKYLHLDDQLSDLPKAKISRLGDLLKSPRRVLYQNTKTYDSNDAPASAVPFISGVDLDGDTMGIKWDSVKYVEDWMAEKYPKGKLFSGALLIKVKGPNQHTVYISDNKKNALVSGTVFFSGVKSCNPYYLTCYLSSKAGVEWRSRLRTNTTVEFIGNEELRNVPVYLPCEKIQSYIGAKLELAEKCRKESEVLWSELNKNIEQFFIGTPSLDARSNFNKVDSDELTSNRMDAWFYQKKFMDLYGHIQSSRNFVQITSIAELVPASKRATKPSELESINYIEISSIDIFSSVINPSVLECGNLPVSAKKTLKAGNIIASTVRVNRKCIAVVPSHLDGSIGSNALAVLETSSIEDAYYLEAILKHDVSTAQIMRWNTGSVYPTISEDVFGRILIPNVDPITRKKLGRMGKQRSELLYKSISLIAEAKSEVEALIEGKLDTDAILSGKLKAPTWEDTEKELEGI